MLLIFLWFNGFGMLSGQTIAAIPNHVLLDESAVLRAQGLEPDERVIIRGELIDGAKEHWSAEAEFVAGADGIVDTSKQAPVRGSYRGVSAMGLVWSMVPDSKNAPSYVYPRRPGLQTIEFRLWRRDMSISSTQLTQQRNPDGVRVTRVRDGIQGLLYEPATSSRYPGILVLGGSEGGIPSGKAAWLASRGYAALALAYFGQQGLPKELAGIPLEYFGAAIRWMASRPEIQPDHIGVLGTSRGGELALQLGSIYPQIRVVVVYAAANVRHSACCNDPSVPYAWTWKGSPLAFVSPRPTRSLEEVADATIGVENINGPILLISGRDDHVWRSSTMADAIVNRLKAAHFSHRVEQLDYVDAGHRAGWPEIIPMWQNREAARSEEDWGGSVEGNAHSSLDAIHKVLEFLCQSLQSCSSSQ